MSKKPAKTISRNSKRKNSKFLPAKKSHRFAILSFIVVFAMIGAAWLLYSHAATPNVAQPDDNSLVNYSNGGAISMVKDPSGKITFSPYVPLQARLLNDGELVCNNGSNDSLNTVQLSSKESQQIQQTVDRMLNGIDKKFVGQTNGSGGQYTVNPISITVGDGSGNVTNGVTVDSSAAKPAGFQAVENYLKSQCNRANRKTDVSKLVSARLHQSNLALNQVNNWFFPQAAAATVYRSGSARPAAALYAHNDVNFARGTQGLKMLGGTQCEFDTARNVAVLEDDILPANISGMVDPPFSYLLDNCHGSWAWLGANVAGYNGPCTIIGNGPDGKPGYTWVANAADDAGWAKWMVLDLWWNSPEHKANILYSGATTDGEGMAVAVSGTNCFVIGTEYFSQGALNY